MTGTTPERPADYRPNVAAVVVDGDGHVLACHRSDRSGAWQLPQGGIDPGESPLEAMYRELEEEVGTAAVELIGSLDSPIRYEWPSDLWERGFRGQEQWYFLVRLADRTLIDLERATHKEFDKVEWVAPDELLERVSGFKAVAYRSGIRQLAEKYPEALQVR